MSARGGNAKKQQQFSNALAGLPLDMEMPEKLLPLIGEDPNAVGPNAKNGRWRYYIMYGGRDASRSWSAARALLIQGLREPLLILCAREVMKSISESVHRLLVSQIELLGLQDFYEVQETKITGKNGCGAEFIFCGLRSMNAKDIKSYEGVDICWVEEAESVTKKSWNILIPTIRAVGSEIWATFNPQLDTDETYKRFVVHPPEDAWVKKMTWEDNPWFSEVLNSDRKQMLSKDPEEYAHIYGGNARSVVAGAIYAKEVLKMIEERRFRPVPYDPRLRVHTIWDLGWNDATAIIFAQRLHSEVRVIDYEEESFMRPDEWAKIINNKPYVYGDHWLPHDGEHETLQGQGVSLQTQLKPLLGIKPKIIERTPSVEDPIRAARMMFPRVYMDEDKCERLMECLKRFRRGVPESTGEPGKPIKDEWRHGADAYSGLARIVDKLTNDGKPARVMVFDTFTPSDRGMGR